METNNKTINHLFHTDRKVQGRKRQIVFQSSDDITSNQVQSLLKKFKFGNFYSVSWNDYIQSSWLRFDGMITDDYLEFLKSGEPKLEIFDMNWSKHLDYWCIASNNHMQKRGGTK
jgi:hypothetical protein